jgi:hypothetical protein
MRAHCIFPLGEKDGPNPAAEKAHQNYWHRRPFSFPPADRTRHKKRPLTIVLWLFLFDLGDLFFARLCAQDEARRRIFISPNALSADLHLRPHLDLLSQHDYSQDHFWPNHLYVDRQTNIIVI